MTKEKELVEQKLRLAQKQSFISKHEAASEVKIENTKNKELKTKLQQNL